MNAARKPAPGFSRGSEVFAGWRWLCPSCHRPVKTIYYPLPPISFLPRSLQRIVDRESLPSMTAPPCFACVKCHNVRFFSRVSPGCWNEFIAYITGGLLYGHEVHKPDWFKPERKRKYTPRPNRSPSKRRPQVLELLMQGLTYKQIGAKLGIKPSSVIEHMKTTYAQHGVHTRLALAKKLGRPIPAAWNSDRESVRLHLAQGLTYDEVAEATGIPRKKIAHIVTVLRIKGHKIPRFVPTSPKRTRILKWVEEGLNVKQIAARMGVTEGCVRAHLSVERRRAAASIAGAVLSCNQMETGGLSGSK